MKIKHHFNQILNTVKQKKTAFSLKMWKVHYLIKNSHITYLLFNIYTGLNNTVLQYKYCIKVMKIWELQKKKNFFSNDENLGKMCFVKNNVNILMHVKTG